jgi:hypothetical protein
MLGPGREKTVSLPRKINAFVTSHRPEPVCNRCIVEGIGLDAYGASTSQVSVALATTSEFVQEWGPCSLCNKRKKVIRRT